ncbi:hypothetical protein HS088_TW05G00220 [Tripterygium wilfordii]|uniref:B-like cyclin n=1 Tax=Tripterygium wilfordii TaxID=458696 RepID=A0A7J7DMI9_TRIWF|nr:cyclin-D6-1-like [Tripterygium wilfordii]KAF5747499.1 hypothetical protein HS088_TW05G00220 [Tripterygium wilfordii]
MHLIDEFNLQLFDLEGDYMPSPTCCENATFVSTREKVFQFFDKLSVAACLNQSVCYAAMSYFDRYASRNDIPIIEECEQKSIKVFAVACLTMAVKLEKNDIFVYDLVHGELLALVQKHLLSTQALISKQLHWRIRFLNPMCFLGYLSSLLYGDQDEAAVRAKVEGFVCRFQKRAAVCEKAESLVCYIQRDITYMQYKPSIIGAAALVAVQPVENYEQRLAACRYIDADSLTQCLEKMKESYMVMVVNKLSTSYNFDGGQGDIRSITWMALLELHNLLKLKESSQSCILLLDLND